MYKCKECGFEYKEKPEYCDCGNDEFEEIHADSIEEKENTGISQYNTTDNTEKVKIIQKSEDKIPKKTYSNKSSYTQKQKRTFSEQYPGIARFFCSIDPISGGIFTLCIILSFYVIFFAWNVENIVTPTQTTAITTVNNIPSLDSFWNNTPPKVETKTETIQEEAPKIVNVVQKVIQPAVKQPTVTKVQVSKTNTKTTAQAAKNYPTKKQSSLQKTTAQVSKTQTQKTTTTNTQSQINAQKSQVQTTVTPQKSAEEIAKERAEAIKKTAQMKQELENYKAALRNTIGRKIDFTKVIGDGNCTVAFKINSSGRLVDRSFAKQSTNMTLNDAVYAAVMATPSYSAPPSGYNNETLNLNISFYNGNFEISIK